MKALVIALCCLTAVGAEDDACVTESTPKPEPPENSTWHDARLQNYQDAWRAINQTNGATYFFLKSTYNNDTVWGSNFSCLSVTVTTKYEAQSTVTYNTTYKNGSEWRSMTENVTAVKEDEYNVTNVIQWKTENQTFNDTVVFSDGQTCDVLHIPYKDQGNGYELWVRSDYLNDTPSCCLFIFELLTLGRTTYNISTPGCMGGTGIPDC